MYNLIISAFLPAEVIELSKHNVDINPEYADSVDTSTFSMHLLFEPPSQEVIQKPEYQAFANTYQLRGKDAFEAGLDELSKYLLSEPNGEKCAALTAQSYPPQYIPVAMQLANNSKSKASSICCLIEYLGKNYN